MMIATQIRAETNHSLGCDDSGRQVPGRQEARARPEGQGDRGRSEEAGEQGQDGGADDADQRRPVVAVPDRGPVDAACRLGRVARPAALPVTAHRRHRADPPEQAGRRRRRP